AWISNNPESFHPYDMRRWNELVLAALEADEELDLQEIDKTTPLHLGNYPFETTDKANITLIDYFMHLYQSMKSLFELMKENGYKK
ncbi:MAG: hypothetical protein K2M92_00510, partial [Bacteroidales bacterium]|nr:hypothetical protein [Bacteroidales bacterium]